MNKEEMEEIIACVRDSWALDIQTTMHARRARELLEQLVEQSAEVDALRAEVARLRSEPSRGTDHPVATVEEPAKQEPAPFDAASAPVGTVVRWVYEFTNANGAKKRSCEVRKEKTNDWLWTGHGYEWDGEDDGVNHHVSNASSHTITYPAPAERQPCAAWVQAGPWLWRLGRDVAVVQGLADGTWNVEVMRTNRSVHPTLRVAQFAAEDALEADAREVLRLLGKAVP